MDPFKRVDVKVIFDDTFPEETFEDTHKIPSIDSWFKKGPPNSPDGEKPFFTLPAGKKLNFPRYDHETVYSLLLAGARRSKEPSIVSPKDGTSTPLSEKELSTKPPKKWPTTTTTQKPSKRLYDLSSQLFSNWSPNEKYSTMRPLRPLPPIGWKREDSFKNVAWDFTTSKYQFVQQPSPRTDPRDMGVLILSIFIGVAGLMMFLFMIFKVMDRKNRTQKGAVLAVRANAVERTPQSIWSTPSDLRGPSESGPQYNDLPPSYQECTLYSINEYGSSVPLPYSYPEDRKQPETFFEKESRACSENVPEMRTEFVFENGRIVERLSLDADSKTNKM